MTSGKSIIGFSLVELIVVMAILAILAAVAVPVFGSVIDKANQGRAIAEASEIANALNVHNNLHQDDKLMKDDVIGWASPADMESSALGDLAPKLNPETFSDAIVRVQVDGNGITTVSTAFH